MPLRMNPRRAPRGMPSTAQTKKCVFVRDGRAIKIESWVECREFGASQGVMELLYSIERTDAGFVCQVGAKRCDSPLNDAGLAYALTSLPVHIRQSLIRLFASDAVDVHCLSNLGLSHALVEC